MFGDLRISTNKDYVYLFNVDREETCLENLEDKIRKHISLTDANSFFVSDTFPLPERSILGAFKLDT